MNAVKTLFLICACLTVLAWRVIGQSATITPEATTPSPSVVHSPANIVSPSPTAESDLEKSIKNKTKKHFRVQIGDEDAIERVIDHGDHDIPSVAIPIVAIVFLSIFSAPVLIVAVILYFTMSRTRQLHKTVRMMVEKGQEVPAALLAPAAPAKRQRSDMRRGVVLVMVGVGLMLFFAAVNDWEGGAWSIGLIPFFIGLGYLLVWKLDTKKDNPPPVP